MLCPYCLNDVVFKKDEKRHKCPSEECKGKEISRRYAEDTKTPRVVVSAVGHSGDGKSVFFASLFYFLDILPDFWRSFASWPLDKESVKVVHDNSKKLRRGILPPPTPKNFPVPTIIEFTKIPLFGNRFFIFYDVGGEIYKDVDSIVEYASFVKNSKMITFFINLSKIKNEKENLESGMMELIDVYLNAYYNKLGGGKKAQDLLVVFTLGDELENILPNDVWEYLCKDPVEIYGRGGRFSDKDMWNHIKEMEHVSNRLQDFVDTKLSAGRFTNLVKDNFRSVNFSVISSVGSKPINGKVINLRPKRVEDILIWLAYSQHSGGLLWKLKKFLFDI